MSAINNSLAAAANSVASAMAPSAVQGKKASPNAAAALSAMASSGSAATGSTGSTGSTSTDNSTITANDFLTLLVSELQNQDPTQPTDPNAYITQMVGVNSLQQLVSIDQELS
jgi:flagellar basal-body rod modification protein FlgD